jgi:hypothetical protein
MTTLHSGGPGGGGLYRGGESEVVGRGSLWYALFPLPLSSATLSRHLSSQGHHFGPLIEILLAALTRNQRLSGLPVR